MNSSINKTNEMLEKNATARWLNARAKSALVEAAATANPLTKEELEGPFSLQLKQVDDVSNISSFPSIPTNQTYRPALP